AVSRPATPACPRATDSVCTERSAAWPGPPRDSCWRASPRPLPPLSLSAGCPHRAAGWCPPPASVCRSGSTCPPARSPAPTGCRTRPRSAVLPLRPLAAFPSRELQPGCVGVPLQLVFRLLQLDLEIFELPRQPLSRAFRVLPARLQALVDKLVDHRVGVLGRQHAICRIAQY